MSHEDWSTGRLWAHALEHAEMRLAMAMALGLCARLWVSGADGFGLTLLGVVTGLTLWVASEYLFHRFVLHLPMPPGAPPWARALHRRIHHGHHLEPRRPELLFVPWWASPGLVAMAWGVGALVGRGLIGTSLGLAAAASYSVCLVFYEVAHLAAHVPYRPRTAYGRWMKRFHLLHHYKHEGYWFGVTNPLADWLAGTWPDPAKVEKSGTARPR